MSWCAAATARASMPRWPSCRGWSPNDPGSAGDPCRGRGHLAARAPADHRPGHDSRRARRRQEGVGRNREPAAHTRRADPRRGGDARSRAGRAVPDPGGGRRAGRGACRAGLPRRRSDQYPCRPRRGAHRADPAARHHLHGLGTAGNHARDLGRGRYRPRPYRGDGTCSGPQDRTFRTPRQPPRRRGLCRHSRRPGRGSRAGGTPRPPARGAGALDDGAGGPLGRAARRTSPCSALHRGQRGGERALFVHGLCGCGRVSLPAEGLSREDTTMTDPDRITALDLQVVDPLPEATRTYFDICEQKLGMIPNVLKAYAHDIAKLDAFTAIYNDLMLGESGLSKLEREMIAVVVSSINRCWYCQVAHGAAVRQLSGDPALGEAMVMNWRAATLDARQTAMLGFAEKMTKASSEITEADRAALREAGFADRDIWDIANVAGFFNMTNRVASATAMQPNPDYHAQAR